MDNNANKMKHLRELTHCNSILYSLRNGSESLRISASIGMRMQFKIEDKCKLTNLTTTVSIININMINEFSGRNYIVPNYE
jgi:hypothetical protein